MLRNKRIFVSGGAGVIGNALIRHLNEAGANLFVGDLKARPDHWSTNIRYRKGDLNDLTQEEIDDFAPEIFIHLAATFERSTETPEFWEENYDHNVKLSHHLITLMKESPSLEKVVFASSYLIYNPELYSFTAPSEQAFRLKETDPIKPRNLCGAAKLLHEVELEFLGRTSTIQTACARIFRSYGRGSRDVISRWVRMLLQGEPITVYKKEGLFDYIYADDVAEGLIQIIEHPVTGIVNLGTGRARQVADIITVLGQHFPHMQVLEGDLDIPYEASQANMELFRSSTGWSPQRQLEDTIPEIIEFERSRLMMRGQKDKSVEGNILITSISKKVPLVREAKRATRKLDSNMRVYGTDLNPDCIARHFVDDFWLSPKLTELSIEQLIQECQARKVTYIIPSRDGELLYFAEHKEKLESHGIHVMVSDRDAVSICLDKQSFYGKLNELGFPVIPTALAIEELQHVSTNFVVKERFGAGSLSIGLNLRYEEAIQHALHLKEPVFQPYIEGDEVSVDVYVTKGGLAKGAIVRARNVVEHGESQITTTLKHKPIEKLCVRLAEELKLYGHIVMQLMVDKLGKVHIIECNSRFGGASPLSLHAGLDSFYWFLLECSQGNLDNHSFVRPDTEKRLIRFADDLIIDR